MARHPHLPIPHRQVLPLLAALATPIVARGQGTRPAFDLLIHGGRVVDPSQGLSAIRDVGIRDGRIARVAETIPAAEARLRIDARRKIVTPGLVDIHVHVYDRVAPLGIPADPNCIAKGATTVVDGRIRRSAHVSRTPPVCDAARRDAGLCAVEYLGHRAVDTFRGQRVGGNCSICAMPTRS